MPSQPLTYLLKIDGVLGDSTIKGYEGYFTVDEFTFTELTRLANGGGGAGVGRTQFDPLMVDIAELFAGSRRAPEICRDRQARPERGAGRVAFDRQGRDAEGLRPHAQQCHGGRLRRRWRARHRACLRLHQGDRDHQRAEPGRLAQCRPDLQLQRSREYAGRSRRAGGAGPFPRRACADLSPEGRWRHRRFHAQGL